MAIRVHIDGRVCLPEEAKVSVFDRGFLYGDSVFETIRTYGKAFELDNVAAARSCLHLLSLLHGYIVERKDIRVITSVKDLSNEELECIAATVIEGDPVDPIEPEGSK